MSIVKDFKLTDGNIDLNNEISNKSLSSGQLKITRGYTIWTRNSNSWRKYGKFGWYF